MSGSKKCLAVLAALVAGGMVFNSSCGKVPDPVSPRSSGELELQVQLPGGLAKKAGNLKTEFDSLVIEVCADDMAAMRFTKNIEDGQLLIIDTLSKIPAGSGREITVRTIDKNGVTVHEDSLGVRTVRIDPNFTTVIQVALVPVRGSIYLQLGGVPTEVDSIGVVFTSDKGEQWSVSVGRSPKVFVSIDGIPHNTRGTLKVAALTATGDTLYQSQAEVVVDARSTSEVQLSFAATPGGLVLSGTLELPGGVVASANMGGGSIAASERGDLILTEIMYAANDSEYIEVFNPSDKELLFDSLFMDIDGTKRLFTGIKIGAKGYYVFGRKALPWVDTFHAVASALDLSGTGNWITLLAADLSVIDRVFFCGGANGLEWPRISGKRSILLVGTAYSADANNFGRNWIAATDPIQGAPSQMGSPHLM